jgi:uncharacterized protein YqfA (UPF0365 family)
MALSFTESVGMFFRKTPVPKIKKALALCEAAGLSVTPKDLEAHHLCGRDPVLLAEALVNARQLDIDTNLQEMSVVILAGQNPLELLLEAAKDKVSRIETFSPQRPDPIRGFAKDGCEVTPVITVVYRLSLSQQAFGFDFRHVHERLSAAVSVFINTAASRRELSLKKTAHEAELHQIAVGIIPGFKSAVIEYR